jgi:hypothetical protein
MVLMDRKKNTILKVIKQVLELYQNEGHDVEKELGTNVNIVAKEHHVPKAEQQSQVLKERMRAMIQTLPYKHMPKSMSSFNPVCSVLT